MKGSRGLEARLRKMSPRTHRRREELPQRPPGPGGLNTGRALGFAIQASWLEIEVHVCRGP